MTPKEQFEKWWPDSVFNQYDPYSAMKVAWMEAYRLGRELGMEEAANIVIDSPSFFTSKDRVGLANAIREKIK